MSETNIEKLNNALMQLIEAYEKLQLQNDELELNIIELNDTIESLQSQKDILKKERDDFESKTKDLEFKLNDFNSTTEQQASKMDGMLSKIQSLLMTSDISPKKNDEEVLSKEVEEYNKKVSIKPFEEENEQEDDDLDVLDLRLDSHEDTVKKEEKNNADYDKTKIDLGRMESLLNGLNK